MDTKYAVKNLILPISLEQFKDACLGLEKMVENLKVSNISQIYSLGFYDVETCEEIILDELLDIKDVSKNTWNFRNYKKFEIKLPICNPIPEKDEYSFFTIKNTKLESKSLIYSGKNLITNQIELFDELGRKNKTKFQRIIRENK